MNTTNGNKNKVVLAGKDVTDAAKALIMIHGRGGSAEDILSLSGYLNVNEFALLAPQANGHSWYPYSFMAPPSQNEPWLSESLGVIKNMIIELNEKGFASKDIFLLGFSQGACLALEFAGRNANNYGGIVAFTGGLVGDKLYLENYNGDFDGTPVFIGSGNPDAHVPVERVKASTRILKSMNANVTQKIYENMGHTISNDEIDMANSLVFLP